MDEQALHQEDHTHSQLELLFRERPDLQSFLITVFGILEDKSLEMTNDVSHDLPADAPATMQNAPTDIIAALKTIAVARTDTFELWGIPVAAEVEERFSSVGKPITLIWVSPTGQQEMTQPSIRIELPQQPRYPYYADDCEIMLVQHDPQPNSDNTKYYSFHASVCGTTLCYETKVGHQLYLD